MAIYINFGDYTYIDTSENTEDSGRFDYNNPEHQDIINKYRYSKDTFQSLWNSGRYEEAQEYYKKYSYTDKEREAANRAKTSSRDNAIRSYKNTLANMKSERPDVYEWYEYFNNRDGDLTELAKTNKYAKQHLDWYQDFGNVDGQEAATIQLTYGADWDYSLLTPANSFEKVLARLGEEEYKTGKPLTLEEFKSYGGKYIQNEDGGYTVQVDKTNTQLLNKLLRASYGKQSKNPLRVLFTDGEMYPTYLESFDVNGNCLTESVDRDDKDIATNNQDNAFTRHFASGNISPNYQPIHPNSPVNSHNTTAVRGIYQLNRDADKAIKKYFNDDKNKTRLTSSWITPPIENTSKDKRLDRFLDYVQQTSWGTITNNQVYVSHSAVDKKADNVEALSLLDSDLINDLYNYFTAVNKTGNNGGITASIMTVNGELGAYMTIPAIEEALKNINNNKINELVKQGAIRIWLRGYVPSEFSDNVYLDEISEANSIVDRITKSKSENYKFKDFSTIRYDENQGVYFTKDVDDNIDYLDRTQAVGRIYRELAIDDAKRKLYSAYLNSDGGITDKNEFEEMVKRTAVFMGNEMFDTHILPLNDTQIFNIKGDGNNIVPKYANQFQFQEADKIRTIFDIYNELMQVLFLYNDYNTNK